MRFIFYFILTCLFIIVYTLTRNTTRSIYFERLYPQIMYQSF